MPLHQFVQRKPIIQNEADKMKHQTDLDTITASLKGKDFSGEDLSMFDLSGLKFDGVILDRCIFTTANLAFTTFVECSARFADFSGACLHESAMANTDLYGAVMIDALCMTPHSFPGSNLAQARFPDQYFSEPTATANNLVKSLKSKGLFLITGSIIVALASLRMTDLEIYTNAGALTLPFTSIPVNCSIFFWLAPFTLLWIYIYFHVVLNKFYSARLRLPNIYPNGLSMEHVCDPSIFFALFRCKFQPTHVKAPTINRILQITYIYTQFFYLAPAAILSVCSKTITAQDFLMFALTALMATLALAYSIWMIAKTRATNYNVRPIYIKCSCILFFLTAILCLTQSRDHLNISKEEASHKLKAYNEDKDPIKQKKNIKGHDLSGRSFRDLQANEAFLAYSNLNHTNLQGANLTEAFMQGTQLVQANLSGATLEGAQIEMANLQMADFNQVTLINCNLSGAQNLTTIKNFPKSASGTHFDDTILTGWHLIDGLHYSFSQCSFINSKMRTVETQIFATFTECNFQFAKLDSAIFFQCDFISSNMQHINGSGTSFNTSTLNKVNFNSATLTNADFYNCQFEGGDYSCVDLTTCTFISSDFKGVDLSCAKINPEQLTTCTFDTYTQFPDSFYQYH